MTLSELPPIQDITRITYNPDDVIIVRVASRHVTHDMAEAIKANLRGLFPTQKIGVVDETVSFDVMTPTPETGGRPDWITTEPSP